VRLVASTRIRIGSRVIFLCPCKKGYGGSAFRMGVDSPQRTQRAQRDQPPVARTRDKFQGKLESALIRGMGTSTLCGLCVLCGEFLGAKRAVGTRRPPGLNQIGM